jgi:DNA-binding IclR family transcriptional regulator
VQGVRAPTTVSNVGVRLPAHLTATGRAVLSRLAAAQVRALYPSRQALIRRQGPGPSTLAELDRMLGETRERGWAVEDGDVMADYASVGAAALDHNEYPVAGVGLTFRLPGPSSGRGTEPTGVPATGSELPFDILGAAVAATAEALGARFTGRS